MGENEMELLSFDEDEFDLEAHKKEANTQTQSLDRDKRIRRRLVFFRILIMLLAFLAAFSLYNLASELILYYDYNKYHTSEYMQ